MTSCGDRVFHSREAATGKARPLMAESVKLILYTNWRTNGKTPGIEFGAVYSLKMWHLVEIILMLFLITLIKFRVLIGWSRILSLPSKFIWSIAVRLPIGWTPLTDTTDKETNERTDSQTDKFRPSVCLLDEVWHKDGYLEGGGIFFHQKEFRSQVFVHP